MVVPDFLPDLCDFVIKEVCKQLCPILTVSVGRQCGGLALEHEPVGHAVESLLVILTFMNLLLIVGCFGASTHFSVCKISCVVQLKMHRDWMFSPHIVQLSSL